MRMYYAVCTLSLFSPSASQRPRAAARVLHYLPLQRSSFSTVLGGAPGEQEYSQISSPQHSQEGSIFLCGDL